MICVITGMPQKTCSAGYCWYIWYVYRRACKLLNLEPFQPGALPSAGSASSEWLVLNGCVGPGIAVLSVIRHDWWISDLCRTLDLLCEMAMASGASVRNRNIPRRPFNGSHI